MTCEIPPYPFDRLSSLAEVARALPGGVVDCSIGTPCDPPLPAAVIQALSHSGTPSGGYPASAGGPELAPRRGGPGWSRRFELPRSR